MSKLSLNTHPTQRSTLERTEIIGARETEVEESPSTSGLISTAML